MGFSPHHSNLELLKGMTSASAIEWRHCYFPTHTRYHAENWFWDFFCCCKMRSRSQTLISGFCKAYFWIGIHSYLRMIAAILRNILLWFRQAWWQRVPISRGQRLGTLCWTSNASQICPTSRPSKIFSSLGLPTSALMTCTACGGPSILGPITSFHLDVIRLLTVNKRTTRPKLRCVRRGKILDQRFYETC